MRYRSLGLSSIKVSEIGFGCWTMGGPNWSTSNGQSIGWADVNFDDVLAGVKAGLDAGVNHWDNADIYGNGKAERLLARCFHTLGVKRESQVVATKVGHFLGTSIHAYTPHHIRHQCEQSLRNLQADVIDIYYFHHGSYVGNGHDAEGNVIPNYDYLHEAAATMHALKEEGKIRAIGQSAYSDDDFERAVPVLKPDVLQSKANLRSDDFIRQGSRLQTLMAKHGCSFVAFGPLDQGILLDKFDPEKPPAFEPGDYRASRKDFSTQALRAVREKLALVRERFSVQGGVGAADSIPALSSIASRWVLSHEHVCSTIPGFRNQRQALDNLHAATDEPMREDDAQWLRELFRA